MSALNNTEKKECLYIDRSKSVNSLEQDVQQGLLIQPRSLPPKYFYDEAGSQLFDQICDTPEYYPTRTEAKLLEQYALELINKANPDHILEFGSGTSRKTRYLLNACEKSGINCEYLPFDVCEEILHQVKDEFSKDYSWLDVLPLVGDYTAGLEKLHQPNGTCMYVFLGSSIGNFESDKAMEFITEVGTCMRTGDTLLIGVDRVKDHDVLHAAYNDEQGVTQAFNLNLLQVLNDNLDANFDKTKFRHEALYNREKKRIEMYLVSEQSQTVHLKSMDEKVDLEKDERILTELSHKYSQQDIEKLLTQAGLNILNHNESDDKYFSLILAVK
jgi:L-histidine Nalpha-methyltransferase